MSEENAATDESGIVIDGGDIDQQEQQTEAPEQTESATVEEVATEPEVEAPVSDGFQARINKVTADKYAEQRRADALQAKLDAMQTPKAEAKVPTLEDFDYDESAFNKANIQHQVQQEMARQSDAQKQVTAEATAQQAQAEFAERIDAFNKPDFNDKANSIPLLPDGVADALMNSENGPELIYHLGEHLDKADALANMTPMQAIMELGRLSVTISEKPKPKLTAAPDPIEPLSSGSAIAKERGPVGASYE